MGRLIDADKLKYELFADNYNAKMTPQQVADCIDNQPTAYDKEAVIVELESEVERWKESGIECNDKHDLAVAEGFKRALEIVKRGGVE